MTLLHEAAMVRLRPIALALVLGGLMARPSKAAPPQAADRTPVDAAAVARLPAPGTVVPGEIAFLPDGKAVTYLKSQSNSLSRVLWRADVAPRQEPRVIARPPGGGDTDATVSREEALRRERQRLRDTGITHVVRAEAAGVMIVPLGGDLYLLKEGGETLERLTHTPGPEIDPQLTKDGRKVAYVREGELYVLEIASKHETRLSRGATDGLTHGLAEFIAQEEMDRSSGFWWAPDGSKLAYQETDERHIPLYTIAHQGGAEYSVETHRYPFAGAANAKIRLGVVPAEGGETRWLNWAEPDADVYLARVAWEDPAHVLVQVLSRDQTCLRLVRIDVEKNERKLVIEETSSTWVNLHDDLRVVEKTGEILWSSERTGFRHLELRDRGGKLIRTLTSGEWPIDEVIGLDQGRREVWFRAGKDSPLESQVYRVSLDGGSIERVTRGHGTHRVVVARDGEHYVDTAHRRTKAPVTTLYNRAGEALAVLDDAGKDARLATLDIRAPQITHFKNRDGVMLYGAYYPPKRTSPGSKVPLIVLVYGGPHVQLVADAWTVSADMTAQYLTQLGYAVWKCDNRGSSRRGLAFEAAVYLHMGDVEVRDQVDGVRFAAASRPEIDAARVGMTGGSYGGYMTLRALTEAPETFQAGVSVSPVTDWDGYDTCYTERYMSTPQKNRDGYRDSSVLTRAGRLQGRLLLIHGMLDENVHFRHSARLVTALISAARPFQMLPLPDERHSSRREADRKYVAEQMSDFFAKALKPPPRSESNP